MANPEVLVLLQFAGVALWAYDFFRLVRWVGDRIEKGSQHYHKQ